MNVRTPDAAVTTIGPDDLDDFALGCAVLSCGGGGAVSAEVDTVRSALAVNGALPVVTLGDLEPDGLVLPLSVVGAPAVGAEQLVSGREARLIRDRVEQEFGRPVVTVMCTEIGGGNGVAPLGWAAGLGLPLLNADGMGRAFPELPMISMNVAGIAPTPAVVADSSDNVAVLQCATPQWSEKWARALCVSSGSSLVIADYVMTVAEAGNAVITGSVGLALRLGRLLHGEGATDLDVLAADLGARRIATGTVTALNRREVDGFTRGHVVVTPEDGSPPVTLDILNEYLAARIGTRRVAVGPDLIAVFDADARPLATEHVATGMPVSVLTWPCHPMWHTPRGLAVAGPAAYALDA